MIFKKILCGGTFDRLHDGHKAFLRFAFTKGQHVVIGITSDSYTATYKPDHAGAIELFNVRKKAVENFIKAEGFLERATITELANPLDETQEGESDTALLVSSETYHSGQNVNREREKNGLSPLPLIVFLVVLAANGTRISSTNIREGVMTKSGEILSALSSKTFMIPPPLRELLHKPFGTLYYKEIPQEYLQHRERLVTVGDVITKRIHNMGVAQILSVIDFSVERKKTYTQIGELGFTNQEPVVHIDNPAGQLQSSVWEKLRTVVGGLDAERPTIVLVSGEEDLLVIPLIILLPIGYVVLYGQPQEGVVAVEVTKQLQDQVSDLLRHYTHN